MAFPVFYVVGNHDVDAETFPISEFETNYGPTNFSFDYCGCLFIVLRILNEPYPANDAVWIRLDVDEPDSPACVQQIDELTEHQHTIRASQRIYISPKLVGKLGKPVIGHPAQNFR